MPHAASPELDASWPGYKFYVNDGQLDPAGIAPLKPSSPDEPIDDLRKRYDENGYLFLKGLLPRDDVLKCREKYFAMMAPSGVLKPGTKPVEGIFDDTKNKADYPGIGAGAAGGNGRPGEDTAAAFVDLALKAHYEEWYCEDFVKHPILWNFVSKMSGWDENTLGLRRTLLRNNTPGNHAIGVHYDQIFLRYGQPNSFTAWVPIGDIDIRGGGLIYLENSDNLGQEIEQDFTEKAKAAGFSDEETRNAFNQNMMGTGLLADGPAQFGRDYKRRWLLTDYEAGDVVLHKPHMIHASTINHDPHNRIRLGTDLRFVDASGAYDKRWTNHYEFGDGV
ncbi:phytanoyl-hydroxylase [Diplodia corticola]|uniref:Phytanoyl-hydroxylase n=1 Tax=Diplodia corticola TaxID=236234 RepID=A0A1J9RAC8_9PEZI|nr:phytanoyl-hydroxylase [Diplodia corticola]OJD37496.1 phytanoyl-hydroxylase [Diplodia corticola]